MDFPSGFTPFFIQIITGISSFRVHTHPFWFHHPPGLPMPPKPDWHPPYPPPGLVPPPPHPPQSTLSRFFVVSPVKTGTHSKIPEFSLPCALGLHSHHPLHLPTMLSPGATICTHLRTLLHLSHTCAHLVHLFTHICAPSHTFAHPCTPPVHPLHTPVHPFCTLWHTIFQG